MQRTWTQTEITSLSKGSKKETLIALRRYLLAGGIRTKEDRQWCVDLINSVLAKRNQRGKINV